MPGVSRVVGEVAGADGARRPLYEALRNLICSACGSAIPEGARFTRHGTDMGTEPILPRCIRCSPHGQPVPSRPALLESLLRPDSDGAGDDTSDTAKRRAVERRLGPALERSRRRRR